MVGMAEARATTAAHCAPFAAEATWPNLNNIARKTAVRTGMIGLNTIRDIATAFCSSVMPLIAIQLSSGMRKP